MYPRIEFIWILTYPCPCRICVPHPCPCNIDHSILFYCCMIGLRMHKVLQYPLSYCLKKNYCVRVVEPISYVHVHASQVIATKPLSQIFGISYMNPFLQYSYHNHLTASILVHLSLLPNPCSQLQQSSQPARLMVFVTLAQTILTSSLSFYTHRSQKI